MPGDGTTGSLCELKLIPAAIPIKPACRGPNVPQAYWQDDLTGAASMRRFLSRVVDTGPLSITNPVSGLSLPRPVSEISTLQNGYLVAVGNRARGTGCYAHGVVEGLRPLPARTVNPSPCLLLNPVMAKHRPCIWHPNHRPGVIAFPSRAFGSTIHVGSSERICACTLFEEPPSLAPARSPTRPYVINALS